jgi:hypothetical protein
LSLPLTLLLHRWFLRISGPLPGLLFLLPLLLALLNGLLALLLAFGALAGLLLFPLLLALLFAFGALAGLLLFPLLPALLLAFGALAGLLLFHRWTLFISLLELRRARIFRETPIRVRRLPVIPSILIISPSISPGRYIRGSTLRVIIVVTGSSPPFRRADRRRWGRGGCANDLGPE